MPVFMYFLPTVILYNINNVSKVIKFQLRTNHCIFDFNNRLATLTHIFPGEFTITIKQIWLYIPYGSCPITIIIIHFGFIDIHFNGTHLWWHVRLGIGGRWSCCHICCCLRVMMVVMVMVSWLWKCARFVHVGETGTTWFAVKGGTITTTTAAACRWMFAKKVRFTVIDGGWLVGGGGLLLGQICLENIYYVIF